MSDWTRVRYPTEEVSLPAAWVATLDADALDVVEKSGPWRPSLRLDTPAGQKATGNYDALTVSHLRDEIGGRNAGRDNDDLLDESGKKADLVAALKADDA